MHRADRVIVPQGGNGMHHDHAGVGAAVERLDGLHDRRLGQAAIEDGAHEIESRHGGQDIHRHGAVAGWVDSAVVHGDGSRRDLMTSIMSNDDATCQSPLSLSWYPE